MRTVIILPNNLGDVIMALPVLEAIKKNRADCHISFFVEEGFEGGLLHFPHCDRIVRFPRKTIRRLSGEPHWDRGIAGLASCIDELRADGCEEVINLSQHPYPSYISTILNSTGTAGRRFLREGVHAITDPWSQYLYAIPFARRCNMLHATDVYCRIAGTTSGKEAFITITGREARDAAEYLKEKGLTPGNLAVFQPGAAWPSKRWPVERFIELGRMCARDGFRIVLTGAAAERDTVNVIASALGPCGCATAGELSFRGTMALLPHVRFVVSGDTALMHAAAALGKKVFALFGPTSPVETGPYGSGHTVFAGRCQRRPCFSPICADSVCMRSITAETVYCRIRGKVPVSSSCDVFSTVFSGSVFCLDPVSASRDIFFDRHDAWVARRAFDRGFTSHEPPQPRDEDRSRAFAQRCETLERTLVMYQRNRDAGLLRDFERLRAETVHEEGIGAFWAALLNIRLNSVPLLDPMEGILGSIAACRLTRRQILGSDSP